MLIPEGTITNLDYIFINLGNGNIEKSIVLNYFSLLLEIFFRQLRKKS